MSEAKMIYNADHLQYEIDNAGIDPKLRSDWPLPSFSAMDWAEAFHKRHPEIAVDDALGWFANALMRGFDEGTLRARQ